MEHEHDAQPVPVRVYEIDDRIMVAAPLPGEAPDDITVRVAGAVLTIDAAERGPRRHQRDLLVAEWTIGPYHREVTLPHRVDGALTNATYGNGVLVVTMPKLADGATAGTETFHLRPVAATHGERVGHSGSTITPTTTDEHHRKHFEEELRGEHRPAG